MINDLKIENKYDIPPKNNVKLKKIILKSLKNEI